MPNDYYFVVKQPANDNLGSSLDVLYDILSITNKLKSGDSITFNMNDLQFVFPFLILPLSALITHWKNSEVQITIIPSTKCSEYLDLINFPYGLNPKLDSNWEKTINKYCNKSYLPIVSIPVDTPNLKSKENILEVFRKILANKLNIDIQLKMAINYLVSEAFDNIGEHAKVNNGFIMVQNYPQKEFLDVCIIDTGIGILQSYDPEKFPTINTDEEAIRNALNGKSTKDRAESRGYGISTSRKMLVKGLHGIYFLFSGSAFYVWSNQHEAITVIENTLKWKGTMLALRIPKNIPKGFNYIKFVE